MDRWITDNPPSKLYPIYTRANAGEVMPDPVSPLTCTLGIMRAGDAGWRDAYVRLGTFDRDELGTEENPVTIGCFGGYLYLNMSLTRLYGLRCPGMSPQIVDFTYFGDMPGIPPYEEERRPTDESPEHTARLQAWLDWVFTAEDLPELRREQQEADALVAARPDLAAASEAALLERARSMLAPYRELFDQHIGISGASGVGVGTVAGVCDALGDPMLTMRLVAGVGDVDSAAPSWALWDLSRLVAGSPELTKQLDEGVDDLLERLADSGSDDANAFMAALDGFLARYGSRGPNEWELRSAVWGTRPELVLAMIERMRLAGDDQSPEIQGARLRADREAATAGVLQALQGDAEATAQFQAGLRAALLFLAGRERTKTNNIKVVHEMRLALRELGTRHVEAGDIDTVEQVFMLLDEELDDFVAAPSGFAPTLRRREREYEALFALEPPFIVYKTVPPLSSWPRRDEREVRAAAAGETLRGIPGCPGTATGRARIVLDPADPRGLEPGDVLVAPCTDPAWTPLFVPAAAVVVDVGAQVSHAVIVSRELGIPCVVSVTGATRSIPDGAEVTVDGSAGTVVVH